MRVHLLIFGVIVSLFSCENEPKKTVDNSKGYELIEEGNTPFSYKAYKLDNGLNVYLSKNEKEPRIQTYIGVKVGSKKRSVSCDRISTLFGTYDVLKGHLK